MVAVDAHDVAFGTSRWSSKLVHGGLRYLARGQVDVAHESAVERGILMQTTAPHLIRALPMLMPLTPEVTRVQGGLARVGLRLGDLLRLGARTGRETLPRPRKIGVTETLTLASVVRPDGLRGGLLSWDGQLEDDARLVLAVARTAVAHGAHVHTRVRVSEPTGTGAVLTDSRTGESRTVRARTVINAAGVWAGDLVEEIRLRPSRGTHVVLRKDTLPGVRCAIMAPVPGASNRFVFALPQPDETFYVGLTDEEVDEIPDVPEPPEEDIEFLLRVLNTHPAPGRTTRPGRRCVRRTASPARLGQHHRRHLPQARGARLAHRRRDRGRRQADHLPPDGPGRRRPRRQGGRASTAGSVPYGVAAAPRRGLPDRARRDRRARSGWCAASAPRPRPCSPTPSRSPGCRRPSCWRRSRRGCTPPWPSWSSE